MVSQKGGSCVSLAHPPIPPQKAAAYTLEFLKIAPTYFQAKSPPQIQATRLASVQKPWFLIRFPYKQPNKRSGLNYADFVQPFANSIRELLPLACFVIL